MLRLTVRCEYGSCCSDLYIDAVWLAVELMDM